MLSISISYWNLLKCFYFANTTEREYRRWKEAQRQGEERVTLRSFFFPGNSFLSLFFGPPLTSSFFLGSSYLPQPTYHPSSYHPPTSFILLTPSPPTSFCIHFHCQSFWARKSLSSSEFQEHKIHKSFKGWELQHGGNKSMKARGASRWWQKWEIEAKLPLLLLSYFLHFFCYEEDDNNVTVVFFCLFLLRKKRQQ